MDHLMTDDVLEPFVDEQAARRALPEPEPEPFVEENRRRDGTIERVLVRAEAGGRRTRAQTVRFTPAEWAVVEQAALAAHGLARADG